MTLNLTVDRIVKGRIYPALAAHEARPYTQRWREFGQHYPYTVPIRLQEYCDHHSVQLNINQTSSQLQFYPIGLAFFDFSIDYVELIPLHVKEQIRLGGVKILFYYHEGDNPSRIKQRLDHLFDLHGLRSSDYVFVSANSAADQLSNFVYFNDFELWYWQRNASVPATPVHTNKRSYNFTVLNRLHKSWRAIIMADLQRNCILDVSQWSYCESGELDSNNPIEVDLIDGLRDITNTFLKQAPYTWDNLDQEQRNDHSRNDYEKYYTDAYCNIVIETHFDADQSDGVFLTEKTFKPIKHGQLFFVAGCAGSLQQLRNLGYNTFDSVFDNSYDLITSNTERWCALRTAIKQANKNISQIYNAVADQIRHNQQLFLEQKTQRLNTLIEKIYDKTC
jgi:hypothetical protein